MIHLADAAPSTTGWGGVHKTMCDESLTTKEAIERVVRERRDLDALLDQHDVCGRCVRKFLGNIQERIKGVTA